MRLFNSVWRFMIFRDPPPMGGYVGRSVGQWLGSGQMTKNLINLDLIEIIQFYLKIIICRDTPTHGLVCGWMGGSMGGVRSYYYISNKSWPNWDNSILLEDLWFIDTPPPMDGWMYGSVVQWVGSGHITKYRIKLELIKIIQFCLKIYDLWIYDLVKVFSRNRSDSCWE